MPEKELHIHFKNHGNVSKTRRGLGSHKDVTLLPSQYLLNNAYRHVLCFSNIKNIQRVADGRQVQQNNAHIFGKWERFRIKMTVNSSIDITQINIVIFYLAFGAGSQLKFIIN